MTQSADQARAVAFVRAHGTASEQSRPRVLLEGTRPTVEEEAAILAGQRTDGGWTSEDGPAADAHATLEALRAFSLCGDL
ncbi:MAG TPA: hypothetical protein VFS83_02470 [Ktedonobacterales bacterium]|nr:hypothetical protein [Ktedonobacterales bacterium]